MTEQEAIIGLKNIFSEHELTLPCTDSLEILHTTISALEEIRQYHEIGTVEECQKAMDKQKAKTPYIYGAMVMQTGIQCTIHTIVRTVAKVMRLMVKSINTVLNADRLWTGTSNGSSYGGRK